MAKNRDIKNNLNSVERGILDTLQDTANVNE